MSTAAPPRDSLPELASFLDSLPEPHILFDRQYRIVAANQAYLQQFAPPGGSVVGRTCFAVSHHFDVPCDQAGESCPLNRAQDSGQRERVLHLHHTPRGEEYVNIELTPVHNAAGEQAYFIEKMEALKVVRGKPAAQGLIGRAPAFQRMMELVARVAPAMATVLLLGESGTGKELFARALHLASGRRDRPFIKVNCSAIPDTLFESELFGHERGAFTGAVQARAGWFEQAHGGSIFLDEIGELPLGLQAKLLRTLQEGTLVRLGATREVRIDVRLVAATNRDLAAEADAGRFRQDLFYRLNVVPIRLPSLRERHEDIHPLALHFLNRANQIHQRNVHLAPEALTLLEQHPWPGNIRELGNVIERLVLLADHPLVHAPELARYLEGGRASPHSQPSPAPAALAAPATAPSSFSAPTAAIEAAFSQINGPLVRDYQPAHSHSSDTLTQALALHQGNQSRAAQSLGLTLRQFAYRLKKAGLR